MSKEPDWEKLREIGIEVDRLVRTNKWTRDDFERLFPIAHKAARGDDDLLEFLYNEADESWLDGALEDDGSDESYGTGTLD
jgi:hypothetical protein